jgi:hypothetical protein
VWGNVNKLLRVAAGWPSLRSFLIPLSSPNRNVVIHSHRSAVGGGVSRGGPLWERAASHRSHLQHHVWNTPTRELLVVWCSTVSRVNYPGWCRLSHREKCLSYSVVGWHARPGINTAHVPCNHAGGEGRERGGPCPLLSVQWDGGWLHARGSLISASSAASSSVSSTSRAWPSGTSAICGSLEHWSGEGAGAGSSGFRGGSHGNTVHSNHQERHRQNFAFLKFAGFFLRADALKEGSMGRSSRAGR